MQPSGGISASLTCPPEGMASNTRVKALLLCGPGANQRALAKKLRAVAPLIAIGLVKITPPRVRRKLFPRILSAALGLPLRRAWFQMLSHYNDKYPEFPRTELSTHE